MPNLLAYTLLLLCAHPLQAASDAARANYSTVFPSPSAVTPDIDPRALTLLHHVQTRLHSIQTLSAICTHTSIHSGKVGPARPTIIQMVTQIQLMRPNFTRLLTSLKYRQAGATEWHKVPQLRTKAADGSKVWSVYDSQHEYSTWKIDGAEDVENTLRGIDPLASFFDRSQFVTMRIQLLQSEGLLRAMQLRGRQTWQANSYRIVRLAYQPVGNGQNRVTEDYYIGDDLLIHRIHTFESATDKQNFCSLTNVRVNAPMTAAAFAYQPPKECHSAKDSQGTETAQLANGTAVPDFTVQGQDGKPICLSDYRGKAVILDFWATWCGNCLQAFPEVDGIAKKYKDKNVVVLAIDVGDSTQVFQSWLAQHMNYASLVFAIDPGGIEGTGIDSRLFKVGGLPTVYVIAPDGKIAASFVGYDDKGEAPLESAIQMIATH